MFRWLNTENYVSLKEHVAALRAADKELAAERDRRYSEVTAATQRALQVKAEGEEKALELARQIEAYKEEKNNRLREQIQNERGEYATHSEVRAAIEKIEVALKPLVSNNDTERGARSGIGLVAAIILSVIAAAGTLGTLYGIFSHH
ncbi:MAG TPA: hypothetical protein VNX47_05845 [Nevskia sp.]|jgi:hypothetical protein|nr:hypothetical protein [Nevskia sp.]